MLESDVYLKPDTGCPTILDSPLIFLSLFKNVFSFHRGQEIELQTRVSLSRKVQETECVSTSLYAKGGPSISMRKHH